MPRRTLIGRAIGLSRGSPIAHVIVHSQLYQGPLVGPSLILMPFNAVVVVFVYKGNGILNKRLKLHIPIQLASLVVRD